MAHANIDEPRWAPNYEAFLERAHQQRRWFTPLILIILFYLL